MNEEKISVMEALTQTTEAIRDWTLDKLDMESTRVLEEMQQYTDDAVNTVDATPHITNKTVHITAEERVAWNAKSEFSGNYDDLTNKPSIPSIAGLATTASVTNSIGAHNTSTTSHNDIRELISDLTIKLNNFLDVDDATTDQLSEVLTLINNNKGTLDSLTTNKINVSDIVDNLTTAITTKVLSANQGVVLSKMLSDLQEALENHTTNHITETERTNWNTHINSTHAPINAEKNQNAFSNIVVGTTTVAADSVTDTFTLVAGDNINITPNATNNNITIAVTDLPTTLPNPNKLTINGVAYDGSEDVTLNVNGGSDNDFRVELIYSNPHSQFVSDTTYDVIEEAYIDGKRIYAVINLHYSDIILDNFRINAEDGWMTFNGQYGCIDRVEEPCIYDVTALIRSETVNMVELYEYETAFKSDLPDRLPNPNALTFTGAVTGSYDGTAAKTVNIPTVPSTLPNPNTLTINGVSYDGSKAVNVNIDVPENTTDEATVNALIDSKMYSVKAYGAKGDGSTDDTAAFKAALAADRVAYVPNGTYVLSDELVIRENCCLELSQGTVLKFTADVNAITMLRSSSLRGNHATIFVPYEFNHSVINCDNGEDYNRLDPDDITNSNINAVPPFQKWDPQWKTARYVTDINICKTTYKAPYSGSNNFHYSLDGNCYGNGIYLHCNEADEPVNYMWGVSMSGIRIAGGFNYGIRIHNIGNPKKSWNHDMRIEAVIDACKIGVSVENCLCSRLAITYQPRPALDGTPYSEHGIELIDSPYTDLSSCRIWDWSTKDKNGNTINSKWESGNKYQHIAMTGDCRGLILDDFLYNATSSDIRDLIYTDRASNLEQMTILQEPFTRWFKPIDNAPYFYDGHENNRLVTAEEFDTELSSLFVTSVIPAFTDYLRIATDTDGTVYNGIGYKKGVIIDATYPPSVRDYAYCGITGFIPCKAGSVIYTEDLCFDAAGDYERILFFDSNYNPLKAGSYTASVDSSAMIGNTSSFAGNYVATDKGCSFKIGSAATVANVAYIRLCFNLSNIGVNPVIAVDEEIKYTSVGTLADGIKMKAENVVGLLTVDDINALIDAKLAAIMANS